MDEDKDTNLHLRDDTKELLSNILRNSSQNQNDLQIPKSPLLPTNVTRKVLGELLKNASSTLVAEHFVVRGDGPAR